MYIRTSLIQAAWEPEGARNLEVARISEIKYSQGVDEQKVIKTS